MATWLAGISKQHRTIRKNTFFWFGIYLALFAIIVLRLAWLQIIEWHHYSQIADSLHKRTLVIRAERGEILDRNWNVLAIDDDGYSLFVDPSLVTYPTFVAQQLAPVLQMPEADLLTKLTKQNTLECINDGVTAHAADAVRRLGLPGVVVETAGARYKIGVDIQQLPHSAGIADELANALGLPVASVTKDLGDLTVAPDTSTYAPNAPTIRWLQGTFPESEKADVEALHYTGILYNQTDQNFSVSVDPRTYLDDNARVSADDAAGELAPVLGMDKSTIERHLMARERFVMIKPNLSQTEYETVMRLQSTLFVVQPGQVSETAQSGKNHQSDMDEAVSRLSSMLNDKGKPQQIGEEDIRGHLVPNAQPGALAVKVDNKGKPDIMIPRRLFAKPIPGVMYGLSGVGLQAEPRRHYPFDALASATLGWVGDIRVNPQGMFGLEEHEESQLRGKNGLEQKEVDLHRRTIPEHSQRTEPVNGKNIMLTLDLNIQQTAEKELAAEVDKDHALRGECIVADPKTGEILALATYPSWDANNPGKSTIPLVNPAVSDFYEPGSTFKIVAVMGSLEEGLVHDKQIVTTCTGAMSIGRRTIHEARHETHGAVDCERILEQSCNIGAATLALKMGPDRFLKWCDNLGFGQKTGIELGCESPGSLNRKNANARITLACWGFGQSLAATPIQMIAAYDAIANGGTWIQPHLIKSRQGADGNWQEAPPVPRHHVCSEQTAALLRKYLERVVTDGTAKHSASIPGYRVGGKTGTAQKPPYSAHKFIGSFIGMMPIENPRLVILTLIDEPKGNNYFGAAVAGPVVANVGLRAMQDMNIPPSVPIKQDAKPAKKQ